MLSLFIPVALDLMENPAAEYQTSDRSFSQQLCLLSSDRCMMAVSEVNLDDYSVYSHLSDEELVQIAVERSLCEKLHEDPLPSTVPFEPIGLDPDWRRPDPLRHRAYDPSSRPPPLDLPCVHQCVKPPNSLSQFLYEAPRR